MPLQPVVLRRESAGEASLNGGGVAGLYLNLDDLTDIADRVVQAQAIGTGG